VLTRMGATMEALVPYRHNLPKANWDCASGATNALGGPATVARCVDSINQDYRKHRQDSLSRPG